MPTENQITVSSLSYGLSGSRYYYADYQPMYTYAYSTPTINYNYEEMVRLLREKGYVVYKRRGSE